MYSLVEDEWALGVVAFAYVAAYFGPVIFLVWWNRKKGGVWAADEKEVTRDLEMAQIARRSTSSIENHNLSRA